MVLVGDLLLKTPSVPHHDGKRVQNTPANAYDSWQRAYCTNAQVAPSTHWRAVSAPLTVWANVSSAPVISPRLSRPSLTFLLKRADAHSAHNRQAERAASLGWPWH